MIARRLTQVGLLFVLLSACSCGGSAEPEAPTSTVEVTTSGAASPTPVEEAREGAASHETPAPIASAPAVTLATRRDPYARVSLSIQNRAAESTRLSATVLLEHEASGAFSAAELGTFTVGTELAIDGCVTLAPGAELSATWSCLRADAPDLVRDCTRAASGRYRFVATSCDGRARTEGAAFDY